METIGENYMECIEEVINILLPEDHFIKSVLKGDSSNILC
jgi:hypothetical protein